MIFALYILLTILNFLNYWYISNELKLILAAIRIGITIFLFFIFFNKEKKNSYNKNDIWIYLISFSLILASVLSRNTTSILYAGWTIISLYLIIKLIDIYLIDKQQIIKIYKYSLFLFAIPQIITIFFLDQLLSVNRTWVAQVGGWSSAISLPIVFFILKNFNKKLSQKEKLLISFLIIPLNVVNLLLSGVRSAYIIFILILIYLLLTTFKRNNYKLVFIFLPIMIIFILPNLTSEIINTLERRFIRTEQHASTYNPRTIMWQIAWQRYAEEIPLGKGLLNAKVPKIVINYNNSELYNTSYDFVGNIEWSLHNTYLQVLIEGGLIAAFSMFFVIIIGLKNLIASKKYDFIFFIFLPPLIVSVFESNLTPGQAIFFPLWQALIMPLKKDFLLLLNVHDN